MTDCIGNFKTMDVEWCLAHKRAHYLCQLASLESQVQALTAKVAAKDEALRLCQGWMANRLHDYENLPEWLGKALSDDGTKLLAYVEALEAVYRYAEEAKELVFEDPGMAFRFQTVLEEAERARKEAGFDVREGA